MKKKRYPMRHRWKHFGDKDVRCVRAGCKARKVFVASHNYTPRDQSCRGKMTKER